MEKKYCLVAVNTPFNNSLLTYAMDEEHHDLPLGTLVKVPLGKREANGCLVKVGTKEQLALDLDQSKVKSIGECYTKEIALSTEEIALYQWIANYYHYPVGQLIFDCLPKILKRPRELNFKGGQGIDFEFSLNSMQQEIVDKVGDRLFYGFSKYLVHGVTGSGKTAVYLELVKRVLEKGKSVLFLLPEINLTPQFIETFVRYLNAPIYSYNSAISNSDKYGLWKLLQEDDSPKVLIGVRSSIYLPIKNLGLIIVDEEHDQSFKQEDRCPYNARDIAIKKASLLQVPVILGSATPSLETYYQFKYDSKLSDNYFQMKKRIGTSKLPEVDLIDMRDTQGKSNEIWPFTEESLDKTRGALKKDEQVLVFINRLGFANYLQCRSCGHQFICPNCSLNLKYYRNRNEVSCQYCEFKMPAPEICPECQNMNIFQKGFGTEKLQDVLQNNLEKRSIERFDRDEIKTFNQLEDRLQRFHAKEIDVLVGTQMLSKGHNFENVNLVQILGIDSQLNFPDFRANERAYQLLVQVSGRSGRFGKKSHVLIHTLNKDNRLFKYITEHSFEGFYDEEIEVRKLCACPPFSKIAMIYLTSKFQPRVVEAANQLAKMLRDWQKSHFSSVDILGPRPGLIEKKVNKFTWSLMIKSEQVNQLHNILNSLENNLKTHHSVSVKIDVDPYHLH